MPNQQILQEIDSLLPFNEYSTTVYIEDADFDTVTAGKQAVVPMVFSLVPPVYSSMNVPTSPDSAWIDGRDSLDDFYSGLGASNNTIEKQMKAAAQTLTNLRDTRKKIDDVCFTMQNVPALVMLINPSTLSNAFSKMISDGSYTRTHYIVEHWGDNLPEFSASGKIGYYYTYPNKNTNMNTFNKTSYVGALTYQNLMSLVQIYNNNGVIRADLEEPTRYTIVGSVQMYYDGFLYLGNFHDFEVKTSGDNPESSEYSFTYIPTSTFDSLRTAR